MPLRAFLLFGHGIARGRIFPRKERFQCPCGHFCFSDEPLGERFAGLSVTVSMPLRAFLLFGPFSLVLLNPPYDNVSMPLRAFLLFGHEVARLAAEQALGFNALAGIFAFRTLVSAAGWRAGTGFNALAGIFAFRTNKNRVFSVGA